MKMEPKKTYMILHILTLAVIRTTGLSHYVEKLDELPFSTAQYFHFFFKPHTRWIQDQTARNTKTIDNSFSLYTGYKNNSKLFKSRLGLSFYYLFFI